MKSQYLTLDCQIAYNKFGAYCVPNSSKHRPAAQKIMRGEVYEPDTIKYITSEAKEGDIIHAGTYFGDFLPAISFLSHKQNFVWAFEPNTENYRCAEITILLNSLKNVNLYNAGLVDKETVGYLQVQSVEGEFLGGTSKFVAACNKDLIIEAEIISIDNFIPLKRNISLVHFDVEGYEDEAIKGSINTIKRCKPILILEDNENFIESEWFFENILSIGYHKSDVLHNNTVFTFK